MIAVIVGGGPAEELPDLTQWPTGRFIGADVGAAILLKQGISLEAAVGDFDSISVEDYAALEKAVQHLERLPAEKDETDMELALNLAVAWNPERIVVTGVTGGRLDHFISALHAVFACQLANPGIEAMIADRNNRIRFLAPGIHTMTGDPNYRYVSLYPFQSEITGLTLKGFKYEVTDERIPFGSTRFTSNELAGEGEVSIGTGNCLIIESRDADKKMPG
ncbi:thiamine diphosphokinase [Planococcus lenghuensis]|uniref:Thiamine diphosphokinase n=1 Tax=Planococcus lenghuensis TaxID=2213202 RepID=A0A1Q2L003_9BACL|nr:thiamine diphosphokinase [Planococcus lenghuensis]AQQ53761.1 thiamine diphosphokinase [Planococcus lenghuensis]